ncbi:predicted membrane protein [Longilinea arvoryzae]|uniref:Predicted membrane protein n=1 Tax=Longilinea arvoryzae TaxID=360412 RepID=A0A0S7BFX0_9CHLR|nr:lysoplasmalogenase [Longilinea arvoryzae]GAP13920.1 predicted membrane protein [Longilinea arvoryzae]
MLASILFWLIFLLMAVDWIATGLKFRTVRQITKPGVLIVIILWFSTQGGWHGALIWFGVGLVFSLLGDIFLLRPERTFLAGLVSFLLGHVCYIAGFNVYPIRWNGLILLALGGVLLAAVLIGRHILRGLKRGDSYSRLKIPVLTYMTAISFMVLSALECFFRPAWPIRAALVSSLGAASFLASDSILASDRFVRQRPWAPVALMITYHLGQVLIIAGALLAQG